MARRWSYTKSADVYNPPQLPVTPTQIGFLPKWQDPIRAVVAVAALVSVAFCPQAPSQAATVPQGWNQQQQQPVRLPADYVDPAVAFDFEPALKLPATPTQYGFLAQSADVPRLAPRGLDAVVAFDPQPPPSLPVTPTQVGWNQKWQDPVRLPLGATDSPRGWNPQLVILPTTPSTYGFLAQTATPVLLPPRALDPQLAWDAQFIAPFQFSAPIGWNEQQFEPRRLLARAVDPQLAYNFRTPPVLPVTPSQLGFWQPFLDPVRTLDRRDNSIAWTPQPIVAPAVIPQGWNAGQFSPLLQPARAIESPFAWDPRPIPSIVAPPFGWWTPQYAREPVLLRDRAMPSDLIWTPRPLVLPVTPSQFGWWRPFHEIVRTPLRGDVVSPWIPQPPPVVIVTADFLYATAGSSEPWFAMEATAGSVSQTIVSTGGGSNVVAGE